MAQGGGATLIGIATLGFGVIVGVAVFRNRKVFGPQGLLTTAIETGKIPNTSDVPPAFGQIDTTAGVQFPQNPTDAGGYSITGPGDLYSALQDISTHNYGLATKTTQDFAILGLKPLHDSAGNPINLAQTRNDAMNDIAMVESLGLHDDATVLRNHLGLDSTSGTSTNPQFVGAV